MKEQQIEHVFFDLDHTLWDFDKNSELAYQQIFNERGLAIQLEDFLKVYMPINLKYWRLYRNDLVSKEELRIGRLKETFSFLKIGFQEEIIGEIADDYIKFLPTYNHLLDGTQEILEYLNRKYTLHIITNGFEEVQHKKLINSKIDHFFRTVTTSEEVGVKKPHKEIFETAFAKANAKPKNSIMIGDSVEADILGAKNMEMPAIFFNYYKTDLPAEYTEIKDLLQLKELL